MSEENREHDEIARRYVERLKRLKYTQIRVNLPEEKPPERIFFDDGVPPSYTPSITAVKKDKRYIFDIADRNALKSTLQIEAWKKLSFYAIGL